MSPILNKQRLTPDIALFEIEAPRIAKRWKAGQFVIVRPRDDSERIPLTLVMSNAERGSITLVVQAAGKTTKRMVAMEAGEALADMVGPLGEPASTHSGGTVLCAAGGVGVAEVLPVAGAFRKAGCRVIAMCGARTDKLRILDAQLQDAADEVLWATDDGSVGFHGNVVQMMKQWPRPADLALVHVIGPIPMMRAAAEATRPWGVPTYASLNPIMIDGTGMCGGCRISVGDEVKFACVDGPEFDAHKVDFDELSRRNKAYCHFEQMAQA